MLFRVSGKLNDNSTLSTRIEAVSAIAAVAAVVAGLKAANADADKVSEIHARPMSAKPGAPVYIGAPKAPRAKKAAKSAPTTPKK